MTRLDDVPVEGELVEIEIDNWGSYGSYSKNYTSDSNGKIRFSLPPVVADIPNFSIRVNV